MATWYAVEIGRSFPEHFFKELAKRYADEN